MTTITAKTILSSAIANSEKRLTTMLLRYPRWIHAEEKTHRILSLTEDFGISALTPTIMSAVELSKNSSSSRAVPVEKLIQDILDDPADPIWWGKNQKGMQAYEELAGDEFKKALATWEESKQAAIKFARTLAELGAHKQLVNRLLEPFSHITVLVSATEWTNFMELRDHHEAEPHIHMLAQEIQKELAKPAMQTLRPGEWHTPWITEEELGKLTTSEMIRLSTARNASTSYKTVEGFDMTMDVADRIFNQLILSTPMHASPSEHVAMVDEAVILSGYKRPQPIWMNSKDHRNFVGFRQLRAFVERGEKVW